MRNKIIDLINITYSDGQLESFSDDQSSIEDKLLFILHESLLAMSLVTSIEDEFNIEFNDDEVDMHFFSSIDEIENRLNKHLLK